MPCSSRDGFISPIDALVVINTLNDDGSRQLPAPSGPEELPNFYYSTNGDDFVSPIDALLVINFLNAQPEGSAEGESSSGVLELAGSLAGSFNAPFIADTTWPRDAASPGKDIPNAQGEIHVPIARKYAVTDAYFQRYRSEPLIGSYSVAFRTAQDIPWIHEKLADALLSNSDWLDHSK